MMKTMSPSTKHYATIYFPGFSTSNQTTAEISEREPGTVPLSKSCFAFRFFDLTLVKFEGETLKGEPKNHSGMYYVDGLVCSVEEAKRDHDLDVTNISHLRSEELLVKTRHGSWQWFDPKKDHIYLTTTKECEIIEQ